MEIQKSDVAKLYLFELIERTSRFYIHLDEIKAQFYFGDNSKVDDKLIFIQSYKECLLKIMKIASSISKTLNTIGVDATTVTNSIDSINSCLKSINTLHTRYLTHLPRPSEPIELKRFGRIIDKHVIKFSNNHADLEEHKKISIYVSESLGDSVYVEDPLLDFKQETLNKNIEQFNSSFNENIELLTTPDKIGNTIHITIPRIDTSNPCRWPTLIHELGHHVISEDFFGSGDIEKDFRNSLSTEQISFLDIFLTETSIDLKSWLIECWCDLFACACFGPAFWFSQYSSFIFHTDVNHTIKYPVPIFRLRLISNILNHRFSKTLFKELKDTINLCEFTLEYFDENQKLGFHEDNTKEIYIYFREFFRKLFTITDSAKLKIGTGRLSNKIQDLIKYTDEIHENTIRDLVSLLAQALPIPSKQITNDKISQKPTYVQEILLAAWMFRNNKLKDEVLENSNSLSVSSTEFNSEYEETILKLFKRFDQSILRSIQVSEWFDLFYDQSISDTDFKFENDLSNTQELPTEYKNQLSDKEIYSLLQTRELKIIPIMNLNEQLGATSLDIRLGTSFQLFYQNKYGIIDFSDEHSLKNAEYNSNLIDLDYTESITISPGQFILSHTMEYIKLPENISAEIEGRSSFARLGIEIHMTAGFIDPGFQGVVTLELFNAGPNPVKLYPGIRIGQLKLTPINLPFRPYNKKHAAKYKGLLSHHTSMQFKDYEVGRIKDQLNKRQ